MASRALRLTGLLYNPPMTFVRQAEPADVAQLAGFDEWKRATAEPIRAGECFVAGHDSTVLAYAIFNRKFFNRPFIDTLFVHVDHRQTGLGSALIEHVESVADGSQIWTSTNIENLGMQRTLEKLGYRLSGVVNNLAKLPELCYCKDLGGGGGGQT